MSVNNGVAKSSKPLLKDVLGVYIRFIIATGVPTWHSAVFPRKNEDFNV